MAVAKPSGTVALGAEIVGALAAVEALDAGEVEPREQRVAGFAPHGACLDDVVERHDLPEVEEAIVVCVQLREHARVDPRVAAPLEEGGELAEADPAVAVRVHGTEELSGVVLELSGAVVVVGPCGQAKLFRVGGHVVMVILTPLSQEKCVCGNYL